MSIEDSAATMSRLAFFADALASSPEASQQLEEAFLEPILEDEDPPTHELRSAIQILADAVEEGVAEVDPENTSELYDALLMVAENLARCDAPESQSAANALRWALGHHRGV